MLENCVISGFADEIDTMLDVQIEVLHSLGQKHIELRAADGIGVANLTMEEAKGVKARLDAAGIKVSSMGSPIGKIQITDEFEPHFEKFRHVVELAKLFECPNIRMFSFYMPAGEDPARYRDEVFARLERFVSYAKEQGIVLLHENEKGIYGDTAPRCLELMERFYGPSFKAVFDFANFVQCKQDTMEAYELLKPYIAYIHVKDAQWESGEVVPPGEGDGRLSAIFTKLSEAGYEGFLSLEPHLANFSTFKSLEYNGNIHKMSDGAKAYALAHRALKELLAK